MTSAPPGPGAAPTTSPPAAPPRTRAERIRAYRWLLSLAAGVFLLDQVTKTVIWAALPYPTYGPPGQVAVIDGFFNIVHVGNTGAAWSLFTGRSTFLALLAAATLFAIFAWRRQLGLPLRTVQISFGLLCGGIVGNLFDRLLHGHVIDFLDFHFGSYIFPTFNVADSCICVGVALYLLHSLRQPDEPRRRISRLRPL